MFRLASLPGALLLATGYSVVHMAIRLFASGNLGEDDVLDTLYTQTLSLGYRPSQPPLYDWAIFALEQVFGLGLFPFLLLKYALLVLIAGCTFVSARIVMKSDLWALLAVESLALIYSLSWRMHEGFTQAMGALAAASVLLMLVLMALDQERPSAGLLSGLGISAGLGFLTRASFLGLCLSLLVAILLQPSFRARLLRWRNLIVLPIAIVIPLPFWLWVFAESARIADVRHVLFFNLGHTPWYERLALAIAQPLGYPFPLIVIVPLLFAALNPAFWRGPLNSPPRPDFERLLRDASLAGILLLMLGTLLFPGGEFPVHIIAPMFIATPIWLMAMARRVPDSAKFVPRFVAIALLLAGVALTARLLNLYAQDPFCKICRWGEPYEGLAAEIKKRGFSDGTIVASTLDLAGNLRRFFPNASLAAKGYPYGGRDDPSDTRAKVYVLEVTKHGNDPAGDMRKLVPEKSLAASLETIELPWHQLGRPVGTRKSSFQIVILPAR